MSMQKTKTTELVIFPASVLTKSQKLKFGPRFYNEGRSKFRIVADVRHDDQCGNGHNTFSITGTIDENIGNGWRDYTCGCIHEDVAKHFPELSPLIKWHLTSTDGPMHYLANAVYMAGDRDHNGKTKGERYHVKGREEKRVVFGDFPITFEFKDGFIEFLERATNANTVWGSVKPCAVEHPKDDKSNYKFDPKWTISGHGCEWYQCPFDREEEAKDFLDACVRFAPQIVVFQEKFTRVGEGKARELNAARSCAVWLDATDEDLTAPGLEGRLMARLPALMAEFKTAVESLGFKY